MKKRVISLLLMFAFIAVGIPAQASGIDTRSTPVDGQVDYRWQVKSTVQTGTTSRGNGDVLFYVGAPAERDGETDTCGISVTCSVDVGGTWQVNKNNVAKSLGVTIGGSITLNASKTSASLRKGEYVQAYYRKTWSIYTVTQEHIKHTTHYTYDEQGNPTGIYSTDEVIGTAIGYIYKPIMPQITLRYYH